MLSLFFLGLVAASQLSSVAADCNRIVCYHTNWSQYRQGDGKFFPENIDPTLCTHMIYSFAKLSGNHLAPFEWNDDSTDWSVGLYEKFQNLKQINPSVKTLLAVGGWNLGTAPFTNIVQSASNRQDFINHAITFLRERDFDGLDLDWEYPANRGSPPEDKQRFSDLVMELKAAFVAEGASSNKPRLLLTAAVAAGKDKVDTAYDVPVLSRELDFVSLMSYDLHGSWETVTGHNSPLYAHSSDTGDDRYLNTDYAAQYWVQKGMDPSKFNIGMGLYGRSFTLASASNHDVGAPAPKAGPSGQFTREAGFIAYYEICDLQKRGGQVGFIDDQRVPYIHLNTEWVGYDSPDSLREKVRYVKQNNFGGVMVWALPLDDFSGSHCGQGPFPLMHAINDECGHSTGTLHTPAPTQAPTSGSVTSGSGTGSQTNSPTTTHEPHTLTQTDEFQCPTEDGFYPSPTSCLNYFICASQISYGVHCADGLVFNADTGFCDLPEHYTCTLGDAPVVTPRPTQPPVQHTQNPHTSGPSATQGSHTSGPSATQGSHTSGPSATNAPTGAPSSQQSVVTSTVIQMLTTPFKPVVTQNPTASPSVDVHQFCQGHADGIFGDPTNCANFIECAGGRTYLETCAPGTAWREDIRTCDRKEMTGCDHNA